MNIEVKMNDGTSNVLVLSQVQFVSFWDFHVNIGMIGDVGFTIDQTDVDNIEEFKENFKNSIRAMNDRTPHLPSWLYVKGKQSSGDEELNDREDKEHFVNPSYLDIIKRSEDRITLCFLGGGSCIVIDDKIEMFNINPVLTKLFPITISI